MAEKKERINTPIGFAKWAHVNEPKPGFNPGDKPKFQIDVCFPGDDPEWKAWASELVARVNALPAKIDKATGEKIKHKTPIKRELDKADQPTGRFYVTFKTGAQFQPGVFDKAGNRMEGVAIGNESRVRVNYTPAEYDGFGGGITLYLNAVQVVELVPYAKQTAEAYGFEVDKTQASKPSNDDSDLPF
jgi:hypothetical protein